MVSEFSGPYKKMARSDWLASSPTVQILYGPRSGNFEYLSFVERGFDLSICKTEEYFLPEFTFMSKEILVTVEGVHWDYLLSGRRWKSLEIGAYKV